LTTVGYEKRTNILLALSRKDFITQRVAESPYVPPYFRQMEKFNREGAPLLIHLPDLRPLSVPEVNRLRSSPCQIVDIRSPTSFGGGYISESISIWRDGLSSFMGWFLDYEKPIVLVDDFNLLLGPVVHQFVRLGYDNIAGYLGGGFPAWFKAGQEISIIPTCSVQQLKEQLETGSFFFLDVRDVKNWRSAGHIRGAHHIYVGELLQHLHEIPRNEPVFVYCDSGYKGSLAASLLAREQYHNVSNVLGGITAWKRADFAVEY
jgi:hydroxyacylglutathione hydrolase